MGLPPGGGSCSGGTWRNCAGHSRACGIESPTRRAEHITFCLGREGPTCLRAEQEHVPSRSCGGDLPCLRLDRMDQAEDAASFLTTAARGIQKRMLAPSATSGTLISISPRTLAKHICHNDLGEDKQMQAQSPPRPYHPQHCHYFQLLRRDGLNLTLPFPDPSQEICAATDTISGQC